MAMSSSRAQIMAYVCIFHKKELELILEMADSRALAEKYQKNLNILCRTQGCAQFDGTCQRGLAARLDGHTLANWDSLNNIHTTSSNFRL